MATLPAGRIYALNFRVVFRPFAPRALLVGSLAIVAGSAAYCLAYNWAQGTSESIAEAIGWSLVNIIPWLLAFEVGKKVLDDPEHGPANMALQFAAIIGGTVLASMALEWTFAGRPPWTDARALLFGFVRRVPGALLVGTLLLLRPRLDQGDGLDVPLLAPPGTGTSFLPLLPRQIAWIKSAGNYLEIRSDQATVLCRMTMKQAEQRLAAHGFLRIHRSALVNQRHIASIRAGKLYDEVQLLDGSWLRVGGAFRTRVAEFARRRTS